jgi:Sec-independent protein translocase protein TatA
VSDLAYLLRAMKKEVRNLQDSKLKKKARETLQQKPTANILPQIDRVELRHDDNSSVHTESTLHV